MRPCSPRWRIGEKAVRKVDSAVAMTGQTTSPAQEQAHAVAQPAPTHAPIDIIYLITELHIGGAEKVLVHFLNELDRSRYRPRVVCLYGGNGPIAAELRAQDVPVIDLDMTAQWRVDAVWRLYRLLRAQRPAILHASLFHANLLGRIVGRLAGVPIIISCRQNVSIGARWREWVNRWTVGLDDRVIAVCELARRAEIERGRVAPEKVITIYNAVDPARLADPAATTPGAQVPVPASATGRRLIGTVCRFHPQKGLDQLIAAFAELCKRTPDVQLLLVGDGELRGQLETQVRRLGLADHVTFTGFRTDVPAILTELDLFVLPSLWEGLPLVLLEAMAAQLPVVATAVGGTPELVLDGETGLLVPPADPTALAAAMHFLLTQDALRREMGRRGRRRVEREFSATRAVAETTQLYEELLSEKGVI
jgi:sugar transferase (PEP-CTERM/EpsH1 system associated)